MSSASSTSTERHQVDYADYFLAAWKYRHRDRPRPARAELNGLATEAGLSPKYLSMVWSALTDNGAEAGPLAVVRKMWRDRSPGRAARVARLRAAPRPGRRLRRQLKPKVGKLHVKGDIRTAASRSCCGPTANWRAGIAVIQAMLAPTSASWPINSRTWMPPTTNEPQRLRRAWSDSVRSFPTPSSFPTAPVLRP